MALFEDQFSRKSGKRQWRYVALFFEHWKTMKKCQIRKESIHMALFGDQFSRNSGKRQWRYVALFFGHWKTIKKCQI